MNIMVVSPHTENNGNTTVASLLALELASRGQKTCLTHINTKSSAIKKYFGLDALAQDKTCDANKLVKMLRGQVIGAEDVANYCRNIAKDFDVLPVNDKKLNEEDLNYLINYALTSFPYNIMVVDVDTSEYDSTVVKTVMSKCDFVAIVVSQSIIEVTDFKDITTKLPKVFAKPSVAIVNKFDRQVSTIRDVRTEVGTGRISKGSSWLKIRYNPQIIKFSNSGKLQYLSVAMKNSDYAVLDIATDISAITSRIMKFHHKFKAQMARNKAEVREKDLKQFQDEAKERQQKSAEQSTAEQQDLTAEQQKATEQQDLTAEQQDLTAEQQDLTAEQDIHQEPIQSTEEPDIKIKKLQDKVDETVEAVE